MDELREVFLAATCFAQQEDVEVIVLRVDEGFVKRFPERRILADDAEVTDDSSSSACSGAFTGRVVVGKSF